MTGSAALTVLLVGLLGGAHCAGMCGGFVLALAPSQASACRLWARQVPYYLGKTATYALLGLVAGGLGLVVGQVAAEAQSALSIGVGTLLVATGLGLAGTPGGQIGAWGAQRLQGLAAAMGRLLKRRTRAASFGLGALNGLLPCGLVYAALAVAATTGGLWQGALVMTVFGFSTLPALLLVSVAGFLARPVWRRRLACAGSVLMIVLGLVTIARGTPLAERVMEAVHDGHEMHSEVASPSRE